MPGEKDLEKELIAQQKLELLLTDENSITQRIINSYAANKYYYIPIQIKLRD